MMVVCARVCTSQGRPYYPTSVLQIQFEASRGLSYREERIGGRDETPVAMAERTRIGGCDLSGGV